MHLQHRHTSSLLALSLLTPPALCTFFYDYLRANIDPATWDAALSAPNATGTYPMPGFNISGAFSDVEVPGWTMSVRVSTNRETRLRDPDGKSRYFTGTSISARAPDALLRDNQVVLSDDLQGGGSSWKVRAYVVDAIRDRVDEEARDDDGSCTSFLSAECINDWQAAYVESNDSVSISPDACTRDLGDGWGVWASLDYIPLSAFNGTELFARADTDDELEDDDDNELYADAVRDIWPVMMVYSSTDANNVTRREQARLTCVRARNVTEGSAQPGGASVAMVPPIFWLTLGALGTAVFLGF